MPFSATVLRVFIGSPSDCEEERALVPAILEEWNRLHAADFGVMLLPMTWEIDSFPSMGKRPQGFINEQIVVPSDFMIGIFRDRLGSPTGEAKSGTVEEINQFQAAGKKVLLYFKKQGYPPQDDQARDLDEYKASVQAVALYTEYADINHLKETMLRHLLHAIRSLGHKLPATAVDTGANARREVARQLAGIISRSNFLWELWDASDNIPDTLELKDTFQRVLKPLIRLRTTLESAIPDELLPTFDSIIQAGQWLLNSDGTVTNRDIWAQGQAIYGRLALLRKTLEQSTSIPILSDRAAAILNEIDAHPKVDERGIALVDDSADLGPGQGHYFPWAWSLFNQGEGLSHVTILPLGPVRRAVEELEKKGFLQFEGVQRQIAVYSRTGKGTS